MVRTSLLKLLNLSSSFVEDVGLWNLPLHHGSNAEIISSNVKLIFLRVFSTPVGIFYCQIFKCFTAAADKFFFLKCVKNTFHFLGRLRGVHQLYEAFARGGRISPNPSRVKELMGVSTNNTKLFPARNCKIVRKLNPTFVGEVRERGHRSIASVTGRC